MSDAPDGATKGGRDPIDDLLDDLCKPMPGYEDYRPGTWMGFDRTAYYTAADVRATVSVLDAIGFVTCTCKLDNGIVVVYNPTCPVHQYFCKL